MFDETVVSISKDDDAGEFSVETTGKSLPGSHRTIQARTLVLATGAYDVPNLIDVPGEDLPNVSHYFTAPHAFYRKHVVIVGGKNSAAEAALELFRAGVRVTICS